LEQDEILHEVIETFAVEHQITAATVMVLGGADKGSRLIVGPEDGLARPVVPMDTVLNDVYETAGVGTLFPDDRGAPTLHLHMTCGRKEDTRTGCARAGVIVWQVMEVVITELLDADASRVLEPEVGFILLQPGNQAKDRIAGSSGN
jgi:predicted DNA-binding protein with PD1-like motif